MKKNASRNLVVIDLDDLERASGGAEQTTMQAISCNLTAGGGAVVGMIGGGALGATAAGVPGGLGGMMLGETYGTELGYELNPDCHPDQPRYEQDFSIETYDRD